MSDNNKTTTGCVLSKDGTSIGYTKFGEGPAIVICHGSYTVQQDWFAFAQELAARNTVYIYDRRGRGESIDTGKPYSFERELDDLAVMVALGGKDTSLLGHSFGGGVVLAYIIHGGFKGKVIMYEPMNSIFRQVGEGHLEGLKKMVDKGDLDAATFLTQTKVIGLPSDGVEMFRKNPYWSVFTQYTPIFIREMQALGDLKPTPVDAEKIKAKTWLLLGEESWPIIRIASAGVVSLVRGLTVYPVIGQHHMAFTQNPKLLKDLVLRCLNGQ
jgi:pimeloyl-ACP methyl ester carboxylesterase